MSGWLVAPDAPLSPFFEAHDLLQMGRPVTALLPGEVDHAGTAYEFVRRGGVYGVGVILPTSIGWITKTSDAELGEGTTRRFLENSLAALENLGEAAAEESRATDGHNWYVSISLHGDVALFAVLGHGDSLALVDGPRDVHLGFQPDAATAGRVAIELKAILPGALPVSAAEIFVVASHLDHWGPVSSAVLQVAAKGAVGQARELWRQCSGEIAQQRQAVVTALDGTFAQAQTAAPRQHAWSVSQAPQRPASSGTPGDARSGLTP